MSVKRLLLEFLEELLETEFKHFKWHLSEVVLEGFKPIGKSLLEGRDRMETVEKIVGSYDEQGAVKITVEVLKLIGNNCAAEKLKNKWEASSSASAGASPAAPLAPAAAAPSTMTAQDQSVLIAPSFTGAHVGTMNINIHK